MSLKRNTVTVDRGFAAAAQRFPGSEIAIRRLMATSESFCEICDELAMSDAALGNAAKIPGFMGEARRAEWREIINQLVREIQTALR
jgi:hypothetical protein